MDMDDWFLVQPIVENALREDIGRGDITTLSIVGPRVRARGQVVARASGIVAGLPLVGRIFSLLDSQAGFRMFVRDGDAIHASQVLAEVTGSARAILSTERVALNFLQRMSGIATRVASLVSVVGPFDVKIVDTRKTTPGLRLFEKYAVRVGGGRNHRFALDDAVLIKDNHIRVAGSISRAVESVRARIPHTMKIEVEAENEEQVREALGAGVEIIMLDNMPVEMLGKMVALVNGQALVEASGGINEETIVDVAKTGVDLISIGALTHSIEALDISLEVELVGESSDCCQNNAWV